MDQDKRDGRCHFGPDNILYIRRVDKKDYKVWVSRVSEMSETETVGRILLNHNPKPDSQISTLTVGQYPSDFKDNTDEEIADKY